jgi:hypothetical protein
MRVGLQPPLGEWKADRFVLTSIKPLLFGYLRVRISAGLGAAETGRRLLGDFADAEGFALVDVFIDADENAPQSAVAALIRCVRASAIDLSPVAIAVPDLGHLGTDAVTQRQMRARIEHEAGVPLIVLPT